MNMIRIAICDNDRNYAEYIEQLLKKNNFRERLKIEKFVFPELILSNVKSGIVYDIIIMETTFNNTDGITIANEIRKFDNMVQFIYISSSSRYCVESYILRAYSFMLKPINTAYFIDTLKKCIIFLQNNQERFVCLPIKNGLMRTSYAQIEYIDVYNKIIEYHFSDGNVISYMGYIKELEEKLSVFPCFFKITRSIIINMDYVVKIQHCEIILESGICIIVGKNKNLFS